MDGASPLRTASIYRMGMPKHVCPYGLKQDGVMRRMMPGRG